jgi:RHS repeat-associated protein
MGTTWKKGRPWWSAIDSGSVQSCLGAGGWSTLEDLALLGCQTLSLEGSGFRVKFMHNAGDTGNSLAAQKSNAKAGLHYYRARYYDSAIGRFDREDPVGFDGGTNFYDYVANNPIVLIDPWGLWICAGTANCNFSPELRNGLDRFEKCLGGKQPLIVTSGVRPPTPKHPNGSHARGEACDIGRNTNPDLSPDNVKHCFLQSFPQGYCQEEGNEGPGTHFHLQLHTLPGGTPRCADGIQPYDP